MSKLQSTCTEDFWGKFFFEKEVDFFYHFRRLSGNLLSFCQKVSHGNVKTTCYVSIGTSWGWIVFSGKLFFSFINFGSWGIILRILLVNNQQGCQNCILRVHRIILRRLFFWMNSIFSIFFRHWTNIFRFFVVLFERICQNCSLHMYRGTFQEIFFSKTNSFFIFSWD